MKKIRNKIIYLLLVFNVIPFFSISQNNDFQIWSSIRLNQKIFKRTNISIKEGFRFRENSRYLDKSFTDFKLTHRIKKTDIIISTGYRFSNNRTLDFNSNYINRFYIDFSHRYKFQRLKISIRNRVQYQGLYRNYKTNYRQKTEIAYNIRKNPLDPYFQFEAFINVDDIMFEKFRYTAGFSYPLSKGINSSIFYRIQTVINDQLPSYIYIMGTSISYKL
tara:strand:+ start:36967 stop:37623 length:657 start_codon:yes stop_codon:yes gene_type:complete